MFAVPFCTCDSGGSFPMLFFARNFFVTKLNFRDEVKFVTNFNFRDDVFGVWVVGQGSGDGCRGPGAGGRGPRGE